MRVVPFAAEHVPAAAALVAADARRRPLIRAMLGPDRVGGLLASPSLNGLGVAALEGERVAGFLVPWACLLWECPAAYTAEWGWVARGEETLTALYAAASERWLAEGRRLHAITVWADEPRLEEAWHSLGFGRSVVDAGRDLRPVEAPRAAVPIRRAGPEDAESLCRLERALGEYLAAPPVCRPPTPAPSEGEVAARLTDPARPIWLAEEGRLPVGFVSLQSAGDPPAALRSPQWVRCDGAFVVPGGRRLGIGAALVQAALGWAREAGFTACSLDYESANPAAARFWPRLGFRAILHSLVRRVE